jgi:hypothetical protein
MHSVRIAVIAVGIAVGIGSAHAQNLIVNPNFATDVSGWTADTGTSIFRDSSQDAGGSATSGAMSVFPSNGQTFNLSVHQCFAVTGGTDYSFGAKIKPGTVTSFGMMCQAFTGSDCAFLPIGSASAIIAGPADQNGWVPLHTESPYLLPASAQGVSCEITGNLPLPPLAGAPQPNGVFTSLWADDVFFAPGTTPVSLQAFDID